MLMAALYSQTKFDWADLRSRYIPGNHVVVRVVTTTNTQVAWRALDIRLQDEVNWNLIKSSEVYV